MSIEGIEWRARREQLGLSQAALADLFGVGQNAVAQWETGARAPKDAFGYAALLGDLEDVLNELTDELLESVESASARHDSPRVTVRTFASDEAFHAADSRAKAEGWPAVLHRVAAAKAASLLRDDGIEASIVEA